MQLLCCDTQAAMAIHTALANEAIGISTEDSIEVALRLLDANMLACWVCRALIHMTCPNNNVLGPVPRTVVDTGKHIGSLRASRDPASKIQVSSRT